MLSMRSVRPMLAVLLSVSLVLPGVSSGQAIGLKRPDKIPPKISHTSLSEFPSGIPVRIQATVTDNEGIREVSVHYREAGTVEYKRIKMLEAPGKDIYSADLPPSAGSKIEYFIQATDLAGNISPEQLVEPYVITLKPVAGSQTAIAQAPDSAMAQSSAKKEGINKWVWIGLGVVAAGALLSSGGGGGGTSGTGTVTITGPVP